MLKNTRPDAVLNADNTAGVARPTKKRRRRKSPSDASRQVAVKQAAMPGVDAFGKVTHWNLFSTTARNERRAHQTERAEALQDIQQTQQQADLAAEAARARSACLAGGLARVQALRDAAGTLGEQKKAIETQRCVEGSAGTGL